MDFSGSIPGARAVGVLLAVSPLAVAAACASAADVPSSSAPAWSFLRERYDADGDGRITRAEYPRSDPGFRNLDADGDGTIAPPDFEPRFDGVPRGWESLAEFEYGEGGPALGDVAPPVRLPTTTGETVALADFRGSKPVVLVFGSYT